MWFQFLVLLACVTAAPGEQAISVDDARALLVGQLADHVHVCIGVGDGVGAAKAVSALLAIADDQTLATEVAFAVLDLYAQTDSPRDIRSRLISPDKDIYKKARGELIDALKKLTAARTELPDKKEAKVLGTADGCPATFARAFAQTPDGTVLVLSDTISRLDGTRWQVMGPEAIRVHQPVSAIFVDSRGRTWLGSTAPRRSSPGLAGQLEQHSAGPVGYFEPGKGGLLAERWHVFGGADEITSFAENKKGVWVASRTRILFCDGDRLVPFDCPLPYSPFRKLLADLRSDDLWVIDTDRVSRLGSGGWRSWKLDGRAPVGGCMTSEGPAILLRSGLLFARPGGQFAEVRFDCEMADVASDRRDSVWCVTTDGRVIHRTPGGWQAFDAPAGLRSALRPAIFLDRAGRVWLSRGLGIEVCANGPGKGKPIAAAADNAIALHTAPLISAAGSGGWLSEPQIVQIKNNEDEGNEATSGTDDLGGFAEDGGAKEATPKSLLEDLSRSPSSPATFIKLMRLLEKTPDAAVRRKALETAMSGLNPAFLSDSALVNEFADQESPVKSCRRLLYAWFRSPSSAARDGMRSVLFELLAQIGFGEMARPEFALDDVMSGAPRDDLARAGLYSAVTLIDKWRILRAEMSAVEPWADLLKNCVAAGDVAAARKYLDIAAQSLGNDDLAKLRPLVAPTDASGPSFPSNVDSVSLAPYRWIRRLKIKADSGMGPGGGDGCVRLCDEAAGTIVSIRPDGSTIIEKSGVGLRALLPSSTGALAICSGAHGLVSEYLPPPGDAVVAPIRGLTDSFDGFSATAVRDDVFYCFDGGLTKVDLKAGKVAWRNEAITGGANSWRSLLERSLPVPDGADVFVVAGRVLHCVDAATGTTRWTSDCGAEATPAAAGDVVAVAAGRYEVRGLNRKTGDTIWKHLTGHGVDTGLLTDGVRAFYAAWSGRVVALDLKTGEFLWARPTDISLDPPASPREGPTAMVVHGGRLVACNRFGYIEFDAKTGSILRRLPVSTARPMLSTPQGVVVMTAPDRLVCIAPAPATEPWERVLRLAEELVEKNPKAALGIARMVAAYIDPPNLRAHELALELAVKEGKPVQWQNCYSMMLASVDPFTPEARALMRKHLGRAWAQGARARAEFGLVARAHIERGAVHEAAKTFAALGQVRNSVELMGLMLRLYLAAGLDEHAKQVVGMLKAFGNGPEVAIRVLASEGREEEAVELAAAAFAGDKNRLPILYAAVGLSGGVGLFERAKEMLDRSKGFLSRRERGLALAWLLTSAGVANNILEQERVQLADKLARYRALLHERREALQALGEQAEIKATEAQLELLNKAEFP